MDDKPKRTKSQSTGRARSRKASDRLAAPPEAASDRPPDKEEGRSPSDLQALIRERAYWLYKSCGCQCGHDLDHWLEAERELIVRQEGNR